MRRIVATAIDAAAFAPFGTLLKAPVGEVRANFVAPVSNLRAGAKPNLVMLRPPVAALPMQVALMERHCFSTQTFFPFGGVQAILLVAPGGDAGPELDNAQAFLVPGNVGLSYHVGVWHMGMATLAAGMMAMLVHEDGGAADTEFRAIEGLEIG